MAALLTRTSIAAEALPSRSAPTPGARLVGDVDRSACASAPSAGTRRRRSRAASRRRSATTTRAPLRARSAARTPRPMPCAAPVTMATRLLESHARRVTPPGRRGQRQRLSEMLLDLGLPLDLVLERPRSRWCGSGRRGGMTATGQSITISPAWFDGCGCGAGPSDTPDRPPDRSAREDRASSWTSSQRPPRPNAGGTVVAVPPAGKPSHVRLAGA